MFEKINAEFRTVANKAEADRRAPSEKENTTHLTELQKAAWKKILTSAATAEAEEESMVRPLKQAFSEHAVIVDYIGLHADDEFRHAKLLNDYVKINFNYEKTKPTLSDRVIYGGAFAVLGKIGIWRPLPFLGALFYYENFAELFYAQLRARAVAQSLPQLAEICSRIQKDELRHAAGIKNFLAHWKSENPVPAKIDLLLTKTLFALISADINTHYLAIHNRRLRENMLILGIDPDEIHQRSTSMAQKTFEKVAQIQVSH